ncbi:hypothetical protein DPSP01_010806 [Paraphaeosphaeria sporulosa]
MKFTTIFLNALIGLATAAPVEDPSPALLEKRYPPNVLTPLYSHRWSNNVWTPATDSRGNATWGPSDSRGFPTETISTFSITPALVNQKFELHFFSPGGYPPIQAIQLWSNTNVPPSANTIPSTSTNGRNVHLGTFRADATGDAVEIPGNPSGWKSVTFGKTGRYAFSVVGIWAQNPTSLEWETRDYGLYLKRA